MFKNVYIKFGLIFFIFEILSILFLYFMNFNIFKKSISSFEANFTKSYSDIQANFLKDTIKETKNNLETIINTNAFANYSNEDTQLEIQQLFYDLVSTRNDILKFRFIDEKGKEKLKVLKLDDNITAFISNDQLEDKSNKEYFEKGIKLELYKYLISDFDLNVEHNFTPTLRVVTPIYEHSKAVGILIVNIKMNRFVELFKKLDDFDTYLIDKNGKYLLHPKTEKEWTNSLNKNFNIFDDFDGEIANGILKNDFYQEDFIYSYSLENVFQNNQGLKVVFKVKDEYLNEVLNKTNINLLKIIIPFNLIIGFVLLLYYSKIKNRLSEEIIKNDESLQIINKYIPTSVTNEDGKIIKVNEAFCRLTGYEEIEIIGKKHSILKSGKQSDEFYLNLWETIKDGKIWEGELENIKKNGQAYWISIVISPKYNPKTSKVEYISISHNITDKKIIEEIANSDHLTNLANRKKIDEELTKAIYGAKRYRLPFSILMIDIDHFKDVNDTYGHNVGDDVLVELAKILKTSSRLSDIVGRWGGEEFIIITQNLQLEEAAKFAQKINLIVASHKFNIIGHKTVSIGVSQYEENDDIHSIINKADINLYKAKTTGRNRVVY